MQAQFWCHDGPGAIDSRFIDRKASTQTDTQAITIRRQRDIEHQKPQPLETRIGRVQRRARHDAQELLTGASAALLATEKARSGMYNIAESGPAWRALAAQPLVAKEMSPV